MSQCDTCGALVAGGMHQLEHWLTSTHQIRSLQELNCWKEADKKRAVGLFFSSSVELKQLSEDLKKYGHFDKLANVIKIPWSRKGKVVLQFKDCSLLDNVWSFDYKQIFKELCPNVDAVYRISELPDREWNLLLLEPRESVPERAPMASTSTSMPSVRQSDTRLKVNKVIETEKSGMTPDQIKELSVQSAYTVLVQLCSYWDWPPPIHEVKLIGNNMVTDTLTVNGKMYNANNPTSRRYFARRASLAKRCLHELKAIPSRQVLGNCDDYVKKLQKFVTGKSWKISDFKQHQIDVVASVGNALYYAVEVNGIEYISPFPGPNKDEAQNVAAYYCLEKLKKLQGAPAPCPWPPTSEPISTKQPLLSRWDAPVLPQWSQSQPFPPNLATHQFQQQQYFSRAASEPFPAFLGSRNNFSWNQQHVPVSSPRPIRPTQPPAFSQQSNLPPPNPVEKNNSVKRSFVPVIATGNDSDMTPDQINGLSDNSAINVLFKLCSYWEWPPPLYEVQTIENNEVTDTLTVNGKTYQAKSVKSRVYSARRASLARSCLLQLQGIPSQKIIMESDGYMKKLQKFVAGQQWKMKQKYEQGRGVSTVGNTYYLKVQVNGIEYKSPVGAPFRKEAKNLTGYYCLVELKKLLCTHTPAVDNSTGTVPYLPQQPPQPPPFSQWSQPQPVSPSFAPQMFCPPHQLSLNFGANHNQFEQQQYLPRAASEPFPGFMGPWNNFGSNQQPVPAPNPSPMRPTQTPAYSQQSHLLPPKPEAKNNSVRSSIETSTSAKSKEKKTDDTEVAVVGETKKPEEVYLPDDSDIEEAIVMKLMKRKPYDSAGGISNVKTERSETPWGTTYLPSDYVGSWMNPVEILGKICLVCDWDEPVFQLELSGGQGEEARYAFKLTVNRCHYQNERVERTEEKAKEKVTRFCLHQLCHLGQIPHPSVFWNIPLDPVQRLANLAECRLGDEGHQPQYIITHNSVEDKYSSDIIYNGIRHKDAGAYPSEHEAKRAAALFCLKELSKSTPVFNWTFAHGSVTVKARDKLPNILPFEFSPTGNRNRMQKLVIEEMAKIWSNCESDNLVVNIHVTMLKDLFHAQLPLLGQLNLSCFSSSHHLAEFEVHVFIGRSDENGTIDPEELETSILSAEGNQWFTNVRAIRREEPNGEPLNKRRRISKSTCRFVLPRSLTLSIGFTLHMDRKRVHELELHQFTEYLATFDPRVSSLVALVRHWAKVNNLRFSSSSDNHQQGNDPEGASVIPDFSLMDWLVICFLVRMKIIPAPRDILERPRKRDQPFSPTFFNTDKDFVENWRTIIPNAADPPVDKNLDALSPEIVTLAQVFFDYYGESLSEGSWILNTRNAELIYTLDFLKGSFITDLTPDDLENIREMEVTHGKKLIDLNCKLIVLHPTLYTNWRIVLDAEMTPNAHRIFTAMQTAAGKLKVIVQNLQKESNADTENLPDFNF